MECPRRADRDAVVVGTSTGLMVWQCVPVGQKTRPSGQRGARVHVESGGVAPERAAVVQGSAKGLLGLA